MSITATVEAGKIVLPPGTPWPSGTRVRIEAVSKHAKLPVKHNLQRQKDPFLATVLKLAKPRPHPPRDFSENLDYYLYGGHKKKPQAGRWIPAESKARGSAAADAVDFTDRMLALAAKTKNLPSDLADQHDHYVHGLPKK